MAYMQLTGIWHGYSSSKFNPSIQYEAHFVMLVSYLFKYYFIKNLRNLLFTYLTVKFKWRLLWFGIQIKQNKRSSWWYNWWKVLRIN